MTKPKASQHRKHRGYATQRFAAAWFALRGFPHAIAVGAGQRGIDILNMLGLSPEVKATPGNITGALKQAHANRGDGVPFVVWRPNGYGPEKIAQWPVIMRLDDFTDLLCHAGYGDDFEEWGINNGEVPEATSEPEPKALYKNTPRTLRR